MAAHPLAVTKVDGTLLDTVSNKPLTGIISIIDLDNGIEISSKYIRPDGTFAFNLIDNSRYMMIIQSPDFFTIERELALKQDTSFQIMTRVIDHSIPIVFRNIEFEQNQADITEDMHGVLDEIAFFLMEHPGFRLEITGHTDSAGDPDFNQILSQDRADAILQYIQQKVRIEDGRIESYGHGSSKPLRVEKTEEDKRINRRVEFRLIKPIMQGQGIGK
jgi:outer membrane protein OmpA-like peptidoglycan-associated protein